MYCINVGCKTIDNVFISRTKPTTKAEIEYIDLKGPLQIRIESPKENIQMESSWALTLDKDKNKSCIN